MLTAMPTGIGSTPMTFSIMWPAVSAGRLPVFSSSLTAASSSPVNSATTLMRSLWLILWKPEMRDDFWLVLGRVMVCLRAKGQFDMMRGSHRNGSGQNMATTRPSNCSRKNGTMPR